MNKKLVGLGVGIGVGVGGLVFAAVKFFKAKRESTEEPTKEEPKLDCFFEQVEKIREYLELPDDAKALMNACLETILGNVKIFHDRSEAEDILTALQVAVAIRAKHWKLIPHTANFDEAFVLGALADAESLIAEKIVTFSDDIEANENKKLAVMMFMGFLQQTVTVAESVGEPEKEAKVC